MYDNTFIREDAEYLLEQTAAAQTRDLTYDIEKLGWRLPVLGLPLSGHERQLGQSHFDRYNNGAYRYRAQASVPMWYKADDINSPAWRDATILLYVNNVADGDLGSDAYTVDFTTRPFGAGHHILAIYEAGIVTDWELTLNVLLPAQARAFFPV